MTFADWQGSKKLVSADAEEVRNYLFSDETEQVLLYPGGLVIELAPRNCYLQLPQEEWVDERPEPLENRLYEFGVAKGRIEGV
jgi:hypothetical protein